MERLARLEAIVRLFLLPLIILTLTYTAIAKIAEANRQGRVEPTPQRVMVAVCLAAVWFGWVWVRGCIRWRAKAMRPRSTSPLSCRRCGYSMRELPGDVTICPECGTDAANPK